MIGVSRKQVKPTAGAELLPPPSAFKVLQATGRVQKAALVALDHVIVVTPRRIPASLWRALPDLRPLRRVAARLGKDGEEHVLRGRLSGRGATGVTLGRVPEPARTGTTGSTLPTAFKLLKFAGDVVADALGDEPRTLGVMVHGCSRAATEQLVRALVLAIGARAFKGPAFRKQAKPARLRTVRILGLSDRVDLDRTLVELESANLVRWLTALPANKLTARAYRGLLGELALRNGWEFRILDEAALGELGAGAFLAVAQGNATRDAGIVHLRYRPGGRRQNPELALVGKGILFDTGGTNLKGAKDMLDMHIDMSGSAVALGVLQALTALQVPVAADCWLAITENRTGPTAYKQRDVVTASNGTTIEIIHTDAEGRLALADTLALAGRERPALMVDYATLTGACVHALSERYSGVFTNREALNETLVAAGRSSGERVWPFPMDEDFDEDLKSTVADVAQCAMAGEGDHILAARFLQRFVPAATAWVHVDLAAVTRKHGLAQMPGGATGFGVRFSLALLLDRASELKAGLQAGKPMDGRT